MRAILVVLLSVFSFLASANSLTVYTYQSFVSEWGPGPKLQASFEKQCNCQLKWVGLDDGVSILNRLKLERTKTKADVVVGLDQNLLVEANKLGVFANHEQDLSGLKLPMTWKNPQFIPYDYGFFAFIYNQEQLKQPPQSFAELVSDKKLRIIYQDPRTSTPGQGLMLWLNAVYGSETTQLKWQQLADKTVTVTKGWTEAYGLFLKGEADLVLSYTTSPAYHEVAEQDTRYKAAQFKEGHYPQVEVVGIIKRAQQKLARQFLQFLLTPAAQQQIATHNWMLPVVETVLPEGFNNIIKPKMVDPFTAEEVSKNRKQWIKQWRQAVVK
ncbi:thiamine ABC transporter substrate binding subunit [Spartinivicinus ruber]|uniref:thiamine ABC transporter substrate binding subunit n=1 Tax=Spartinivicinus ruber TaxID=2683272 RepID=UPI0013D4DBC5|nr:thiamine ABC transporter substrate binding subunit [Spartinivicinus ruber]